jgi:hypothetical protein
MSPAGATLQDRNRTSGGKENPPWPHYAEANKPRTLPRNQYAAVVNLCRIEGVSGFQATIMPVPEINVGANVAALAVLWLVLEGYA